MPDDRNTMENPLMRVQLKMPLPADPFREDFPQDTGSEAQGSRAQTESYRLPEWAKLDPKVKEAIAGAYESLTEAEKKHLLLVWGVVIPIADTLIQSGELDEKEAKRALVAALLHDISKDFREPYILEHHVASAKQAEEILRGTGYDKDTIERIKRTIRRHQGMPYMNWLLKEHMKGTRATRKTDEVLAHINAIEPLTNTLGEFPPPTTKEGGIMRAADFLAIGALAALEELMSQSDETLRDMGETELKKLDSSGFTKILAIELKIKAREGIPNKWESALEATLASLRKNVEALRDAREYTSEEQAKIRETLTMEDAEDEIEGRKIAARIERQIGETIGQAILEKATGIKNRVVKRLKELDEIPEEEKETAFWRIYYQEVFRYEQELREKKQEEGQKNPDERGDPHGNDTYSIV